jgi:hypothetical protein
VYWSARPQLFSFGLAAVFLYIIERRRWERRGPLWLLPVLMALWVNVHGGFAIGLLLIGLELAGQGLGWLLGQSGPGMLSGRDLGRLALAGLGCVLVVPLNPQGFALYAYPFRTVSIGVLQELIQEWQSPNFHQAAFQPFIWLWVALMAAVGLGRRRIDLTDLVMMSGLTYLGLLAGRNVPLFALAAPPVITRHLAAALPHLRADNPRLAEALDPSPAPRRWPRLNAALLGLALVAVGARAAIAASRAENEAFTARLAPFAAVEYIEATRPAGPLFNAYNWGGFLTWRLFPDYLVYVDGRTDLYDDALLREYLATAHGLPGYEATLDRYGFNLVLIEAGSLLDDHLRRNPDWRLLHADALAVVYGRAVEARP